MKNKIAKQKNMALTVFSLFLLAEACGADRIWAVDSEYTDQIQNSSVQQTGTEVREAGLSKEEMDTLLRCMKDYTIGELYENGRLRRRPSFQWEDGDQVTIPGGGETTPDVYHDVASGLVSESGQVPVEDNQNVASQTQGNEQGINGKGKDLDIGQINDPSEIGVKEEAQSKGGEQPTLCLTDYNNLVDRMTQENVNKLLKEIGWTGEERTKEWLKQDTYVGHYFGENDSIIDIINITNKLNNLIALWGDGGIDEKENTVQKITDEFSDRWVKMKGELEKLWKKEFGAEFEERVLGKMDGYKKTAIMMNLANLEKSTKNEDLKERAIIYMMIMVSDRHPIFLDQSDEDVKESIKKFQEKLKLWTEELEIWKSIEVAKEWEKSDLGQELDKIVGKKSADDWVEIKEYFNSLISVKEKFKEFMDTNEIVVKEIVRKAEKKEKYKRWYNLKGHAYQGSTGLGDVIEYGAFEKVLELPEDVLSKEEKTVSKKLRIRWFKGLESFVILRGANIKQIDDFKDTDKNEKIENIIKQIKKSDLYALVETAKNCAEGLFVKIDNIKKSDSTDKNEDGNLTSFCIASACAANIKREIIKKFPNYKFDEADNQPAIEKLKEWIKSAGLKWNELDVRQTLKALTECVYEEEEKKENDFFKDNLWEEIVGIDKVLPGRLYENVSDETKEKVKNLCEEWLAENDPSWVDRGTQEVINEWNKSKSQSNVINLLIERMKMLNKFDKKINNNKGYNVSLQKDTITKMINWEIEYMGEMDTNKRRGDVVIEKTEGDDREVERKYQLAKASIVGQMIDAEEKDNKEVEDFVQETLEEIERTREINAEWYENIKTWAKIANFKRKWGETKGLEKTINKTLKALKNTVSDSFGQDKNLKYKVSDINRGFFAWAIETMWVQKDEKFQDICSLYLDWLDLKRGQKNNDKEKEIKKRIENLWSEMLEVMEAEEEGERWGLGLGDIEGLWPSGEGDAGAGQQSSSQRLEYHELRPRAQSFNVTSGGRDLNSSDITGGQVAKSSSETIRDDDAALTKVIPVITTAPAKIKTVPVATASTKVGTAKIMTTPVATAAKKGTPVITTVVPASTTEDPATQSGPAPSGRGGEVKPKGDPVKTEDPATSMKTPAKITAAPATNTVVPASQSGPASSGGASAGTSTKTLTKKKGGKKPQGTKKITKKTKRIAKKPKGRGNGKRGGAAKKKRLRKRG